MTAPQKSAKGDVIRFASFEANLRTRELKKHGRKLRLPHLPFEVLAAVLERPGELVTREELRQRLWPDGTFVDFDNNLNAAVTRVRQILGDSADSPQFIETLPRLGYRFIGNIESTPSEPVESTPVSPITSPSAASSADRERRWPFGLWAAVAVAIVAATGGLVAWRMATARAADADRIMLAVLPFDNMSGDPEHEYLSDGVTEELITELARLAPDRLGIIARTTTFRYQGAKKDVAAIADELGVHFVLEGSVRRDGDRVRVTAQLIEPRGQSHVWAQSYDRNLRDLLDVEREVATAVAASVHLAVDPNAAGPRRQTTSEEARNAYLRARYYASKGTVYAIEQAIQQYRSAVELDPEYALAHAALARPLVFSTGNAPGAALRDAASAAERAIRIDPSLPEGQLAQAMVLLYRDRDLERARAAFERAIALDPGNAEAHFYQSHALTASGRFDEALVAARRAQHLDPFSALIHHYIGRILLFAGRPNEAIEQLTKTLELEPNYSWALLFMVVAREQLGHEQEALALRQRYWAVMNVAPDRIAHLGETVRTSGYKAVRRVWIHWLEGFATEKGFVTSTELAMLHVAQNEPDAAFRWLEKAVDDQTRDLIYLRVYPEFAGIRGDSRYTEIVRRVFQPGRAASN